MYQAKNIFGQDCLTIAETLITRAAGLHLLASKDFPVLSCDKAADFMECVWQLTAYTYPESISLPQDYQVRALSCKHTENAVVFSPKSQTYN